MFREVSGIPTHVLLVHAVVVLVPALVLTAVGYAFLPRFRARLDWLAAGLAVLAPLAAWLAGESGEELQEVLTAKGYPAEILDRVHEHAEYGERTFWFSLALGVATLLLLVVHRGHPRLPALPRWTGPLLAVAVLVLGVLSGVFVFLAGDTGARVVWENVL
jgi:uncharacterized membrane protein